MEKRYLSTVSRNYSYVLGGQVWPCPSRTFGLDPDQWGLEIRASKKSLVKANTAFVLGL
jgi:hypothetical protein